MPSIGRHAVLRGLVALVAVLTVVPLAVFLWLGARLLDQDRQLEQQQAADRLQTAADLVAATFQRAFSTSEQRLMSGADDWPDGAIAVTLTNQGVEVRPQGRIAYLPALPAVHAVPVEPFRAAEVLEFQKNDRAGAVAAYRVLSSSRDRAIRSGALMRLARNLDVMGRHDEALDTYAGLTGTTDVAEAGVVLGLSAAWARCVILERLNRNSDLKEEAGRLRVGLATGRWPVIEAVYVTYTVDADRWIGRRPVPTPSEIFSVALSTLWTEHTSFGAPRTSRRVVAVAGEPLVVIWQQAGINSRLLIAGKSFVQSQWLPGVEAVARQQSVAVEVRESAGNTLLFDIARPADGVASAPPPVTTLNGGHIDLPWNLVVADVSPGTGISFVERRRLLIAGFALLALLSGAASWLIVRAVTRESAVARLQSDFVAAVSHEFRTPLTTLRQFTDRLRDQPNLDSEQRQTCYEAQARATDRLTRLVESVLDFGRMEAGARAYRFERHDCADIVERVVQDFRAQPQVPGGRSSCSATGRCRSTQTKRPCPERCGIFSTTPSSTRPRAAPLKWG